MTPLYNQKPAASSLYLYSLDLQESLPRLLHCKQVLLVSYTISYQFLQHRYKIKILPMNLFIFCPPAQFLRQSLCKY